MQLQDAIALYMEESREKGTRDNYRGVLKTLQDHVGGAREIETIEYVDLLRWSSTRSKVVKPSTHYQNVQVVRVFFRWCQRLKLIAESPAAELRVEQPASQSIAFAEEDIDRIVEYARWHSLRNYALLRFMRATGVRIGGAASLRVDRLSLNCRFDNLDYASASIMLKGKKRFLNVMLVGEDRQALIDWLAQRPQVDHPYVWTSSRNNHAPLEARSIGNLVREIALATGASIHKAHAIRHAFTHKHAKLGTPITIISKMLGHKNIQTTIRYMPDSEEYVIAAAAQFAGLLA
jgi:site-specific recombinase XerD